MSIDTKKNRRRGISKKILLKRGRERILLQHTEITTEHKASDRGWEKWVQTHPSISGAHRQFTEREHLALRKHLTDCD